MALLRDPGADPLLQQAALRHSRETHAALLEHLEERGNADTVLAALRAGCMPLMTPHDPLAASRPNPALTPCPTGCRNFRLPPTRSNCLSMPRRWIYLDRDVNP